MKYDKIYKNNSNVWGSRPNKLLEKIYRQADAGSKFSDLGCGQGRDSLFMLQKGFRVTAVDSSREGIKKIILIFLLLIYRKSNNVFFFCPPKL